MDKKPLFNLPLPIIVGTGKHASGKTLWGLSICPNPADVLVYDMELSSTAYMLPGLNRVTVADQMRAIYPNGWKPIDLWNWWLADVRQRVAPGKYRVVMIDPISELEDGCADWVTKNPMSFGKTTQQYDKMSGLKWGDMKSFYKQILTEVASKTECLYITVHMGKEWSGDKPTGRLKPKGKETLFELASLYMEFRRDIGPNGQPPKIPTAIITKSRLAHMVFDEEAGEWTSNPILPPSVPEMTPATINRFIAKPLDYKKLDKKYAAPVDTPSEEEMAEVKLRTAEAEAEAAKAKLALAEKVEAAKAALHQTQAAIANANAQAALRKDANDQIPASPPASVVAAHGQAAEHMPGDSPAGPNGVTRSQVETLNALRNRLEEHGMDAPAWLAVLRKRGVTSISELSRDAAADLIGSAQRRLNQMEEAAPAATKS